MDIYVSWPEIKPNGEVSVSGAPWGAPSTTTIHYEYDFLN